MSYGICGGQYGFEAVFLWYFIFSWQSSFHQMLHAHLSYGAATIGPPMADVPSGISPTSTRKIKNMKLLLLNPEMEVLCSSEV
jgi:hypothetical protein